MNSVTVRTTTTTNKTIYYYIFFCPSARWICIIDSGGLNATEKGIPMYISHSPYSILIVIIPNVIIQFCLPPLSFRFIFFDFEFSFLFYFDASKFIGRSVVRSRQKSIYLELSFTFIRLHSVVLFDWVYVRPATTIYASYACMAFGILHCQIEWLLHNSSIHQSESMLRWHISQYHIRACLPYIAAYTIPRLNRSEKGNGEKRLKIETNLASNMIFYFITAVAWNEKRNRPNRRRWMNAEIKEWRKRNEQKIISKKNANKKHIANP